MTKSALGASEKDLQKRWHFRLGLKGQRGDKFQSTVGFYKKFLSFRIKTTEVGVLVLALSYSMNLRKFLNFSKHDFSPLFSKMQKRTNF